MPGPPNHIFKMSLSYRIKQFCAFVVPPHKILRVAAVACKLQFPICIAIFIQRYDSTLSTDDHSLLKCAYNKGVTCSTLQRIFKWFSLHWILLAIEVTRRYRCKWSCIPTKLAQNHFCTSYNSIAVAVMLMWCECGRKIAIAIMKIPLRILMMKMRERSGVQRLTVELGNTVVVSNQFPIPYTE